MYARLIVGSLCSTSIYKVGQTFSCCPTWLAFPSVNITIVGLSSSAVQLIVSSHPVLFSQHPCWPVIIVLHVSCSHPSPASIYIVGLSSSCCSTHREQPFYTANTHCWPVTILLQESRSQPSASTSVNVSCESLLPHALSWSAKSISSSSISSSPIRSSPINHAESWVQIQSGRR